jgi:nucleotide-binding universal stress UspA family protein
MFKKILVPIDGSHTSDLGLKEAIKLARGEKATLCLLHVVDELVLMPDALGTPIYIEEMFEALRKGGRKILAKAEAKVRVRGVRAKSVLAEKIGGPVADVIVKEAKKQRADLIVLGTHGRHGVNRMVMGSDAEAVIRAAPVPVLLVRAKAHPAPRRRSRRR